MENLIEEDHLDICINWIFECLWYIDKKISYLTWQVPAVWVAPTEDWPLHVELGGGAAPDSLQVSLHHGVGVREVLVLGDWGQALREGEINIYWSHCDGTDNIYKQRNISVSMSAEMSTRCCMTVSKSIGAVLW